jgi:hypothetical protein
MNGRFLRLAGPWLVVALFFVLPAAACAQSASEQALAREQFREGVRASREQRWADAVDAFQRSLELSPRPMTMMNLAGALAQNAQLVEAAEAYRMFIAEASSGPAARVRDEAQAQLATLEARIPHVRLRVLGRQDGDVITLDEYQISAAALDTPLPVNPGDHVVTISRDGHEPRSVPFTAQEAVQSEVVLEAWPDLSAPPPEGGAPDPLQTTTPPPQGHSITDEPLFWIIGGVLVAGAIGAGVAIGVVTQSAPSPYFGNLPPYQVPVQ